MINAYKLPRPGRYMDVVTQFGSRTAGPLESAQRKYLRDNNFGTTGHVFFCLFVFFF
jgi:hypothetical protein